MTVCAYSRVVFLNGCDKNNSTYLHINVVRWNFIWRKKMGVQRGLAYTLIGRINADYGVGC